jgi:hypothetical protein
MAGSRHGTERVASEVGAEHVEPHRRVSAAPRAGAADTWTGGGGHGTSGVSSPAPSRRNDGQPPALPTDRSLSGNGQPFDAATRTALGHVGALSCVHCTRVCQGSRYSAAVG